MYATQFCKTNCKNKVYVYRPRRCYGQISDYDKVCLLIPYGPTFSELRHHSYCMSLDSLTYCET